MKYQVEIIETNTRIVKHVVEAESESDALNRVMNGAVPDGQIDARTICITKRELYDLSPADHPKPNT